MSIPHWQVRGTFHATIPVGIQQLIKVQGLSVGAGLLLCLAAKSLLGLYDALVSLQQQHGS